VAACRGTNRSTDPPPVPPAQFVPLALPALAVDGWRTGESKIELHRAGTR